MSYETPFLNQMFPEGRYRIVMNSPVVDAGKTWIFRYWYDDINNTVPTREFDLNENTAPVSLIAVYQQDIQSLYTNWSGTRPPNAVIKLTLTQPTIVISGKTYIFQRWRVGRGGATPSDAGFDNPFYFNMTDNTVVIADYALQTATLNVVAGTGGTVDKLGLNYLTVGDPYSFTAIPDATNYYVLDHWQLSDGRNLGSSNPLTGTVAMDLDGLTLTAVFTQTPPTTINLNVVADGNGTVNPTGGTFNIGDTITFTATPTAPSIFDHWSLDGVNYPDNAQHNLALQILQTMDNQTLTAYFIVPPQSTVTGFISDDKGNPIINATITDGTSTVYSQSPDGNFSITVTAGIVNLTVSATNFVTKVQSVDASQNVSNLQIALATPTPNVLLAGLGLLGTVAIAGVYLAARKKKGR